MLQRQRRRRWSIADTRRRSDVDVVTGRRYHDKCSASPTIGRNRPASTPAAHGGHRPARLGHQGSEPTRNSWRAWTPRTTTSSPAATTCRRRSTSEDQQCEDTDDPSSSCRSPCFMKHGCKGCVDQLRRARRALRGGCRLWTTLNARRWAGAGRRAPNRCTNVFGGFAATAKLEEARPRSRARPWPSIFFAQRRRWTSSKR